MDEDRDGLALAVIERNGADLYRYLARRTADDAADLLNDTLVIIWQRRSRLPSNPIEARMWSFGVARNIVRRHFRDSSRRARAIDDLSREDRVIPGVRDPARAAEERERDASVRRAIGTLRSTDRELIMLIHWDGFSIADAAAVLRMKPSTARTRYARAKARLTVNLESRTRPVARPAPADPANRTQIG